MKKYLTIKNLGWVLSGLLALVILGSAFGKLTGDADTAIMLGSHNLTAWIMIIGIGELASLILFLIPKTMRMGALLLSAYFGGAIMFHMAHPDPGLNNFAAPAGFLIFMWIIAWVRGLDIFDQAP